MNTLGGKVAAITGVPKGIGASIATAYVEPSIDEYLRERLTPVEGANPHLSGIEMYGNSIPAGMIGGDLFEYIKFQQRYDIDARIQQAMKRSEEYLSPLPPGESPRNSVDDHVEWLKSRSSYRSGMDAAIDTEMTRLRHARFLIAQSLVRRRPDGRHPDGRTPAKPGKAKPVATGPQLTPSHGERQKQQKQETSVPIIRVPTKEPPRRRVTRAETKDRTALTGDVPEGPIAVPRHKDRETANVLGVSVAHTRSAPASAFGLAIARELASL